MRLLKHLPTELRVHCNKATMLLQNKGFKEAERYLYNLPQSVYDKIVDISIDCTDVDKVFKEFEKNRNYVSKYFRSREENLQRVRNLY